MQTDSSFVLLHSINAARRMKLERQFSGHNGSVSDSIVSGLSIYALRWRLKVFYRLYRK